MLKKRYIIIVLVFCSSFIHISAQDRCHISNKLFTGLSVGTNGYSSDNNIFGGYYLNGSVNIIDDNLLFRVGFNTNILLNTFEDKILRADLIFNTIRDDNSFFCVGPSFLIDLEDRNESSYVGLTLIPISSWKSEFDETMRLSIHFLPVSLMYGLETSELLWSFSFITFDFYI